VSDGIIVPETLNAAGAINACLGACASFHLHDISNHLSVLMIHDVREFVIWRWNQDDLNFMVIGTLLIVAVLLNRFFAPKNVR